MQLSLHRLAAPACWLTHDECPVKDGAGGIRAVVAAGMAVVGLCAASHIREGHDLKLRDAGAVDLTHSWSDVERFALHFFNG
jgi:beta-phosphoglucomutase-like phosphatase (HAD superfamily)